MLQTARDWLQLIGAILISQLAGIIGSVFTAPAISGWYTTLIKPSFQPPSWLFGPVWVTLYTLMGIAAFIVWKKGIGQRNVQVGIVLFLTQLVFNALWSIVFFGLKDIFLALLVIAVLLALIISTTYYFFQVSRTAGFLMIPYILWVSFATVLNATIWTLNS